MIPTPNLPEGLAIALWVVGGFVVLSATIVLAVRASRREFVEAVDERFRIAIRGKEFSEIVDERVTSRVSAAFTGYAEVENTWKRGVEGALREYAGKAALVESSAKAAHRRLDEHLERLARDRMERPT